MNFSHNSLAERESAVLREILNRIWEAVVMLGPDQQIVYANRAATEILHRAGGIGSSASGRLTTDSTAAQDTVAGMLMDGTTPAPVAVPRCGQPPLVLNLQPLPHALKGACGAVALMFISDPAERLTDRSAALRSAFGLTDTEARLAQALSEGASLKQIAGANRITYETVRTHLRRTLGKMGARRQAELVRIAHSLR